jgi:hypothetical protein
MELKMYLKIATVLGEYIPNTKMNYLQQLFQQ